MMVGVVLVATAGCGGDDGGTPEPTTATAPPVETTADLPQTTAPPLTADATTPMSSSTTTAATTTSTAAPAATTTAAPTTAPAVPVIDGQLLETAAVGLSRLEQQYPSTDGEPVDLPSCVLLDQVTIDAAYAAIGQPQPFDPLIGTVLVGTSDVDGSPVRSFQTACRTGAPEGVTAPASEVTVVVATKPSDATMLDLIAASDEHTVTNDSLDDTVLAARLIGYCYDYDANSYCFQSFDYGNFAVIVKTETPPLQYDPVALSAAAQTIAPVVLQQVAALAVG
jgi:hypothetical protein